MSVSISNWGVANGDYRVTSSENPHNLSTGDAIRFSVGEGGALPTGVSTDTTYYVYHTGGPSAFRFKFSTNPEVSSDSQCVDAVEDPPDDTDPTFYALYNESTGSAICSGSGTFVISGSGKLTVQ
jgi:hypothetical protein